MNTNQEQSSSHSINIDGEYVQICNSMAKVSAALRDDPLTHLAAVRNIGIAASHIEIAANHIDQVYRGAKAKDREILMLSQRIKKLDDIIKKKEDLSDELRKLKSINAVLRSENETMANATGYYNNVGQPSDE